MARALILGALGLIAVTAVLTYALTRALAPAKPMTTATRRWIGDAVELLARLRNPSSLDEVEVISQRSKRAADNLLARHEKGLS